MLALLPLRARLLGLALIAFAIAVAGMPSSASATSFGMGEQDERIFNDKRFTGLKKIRSVRYIAPWDVERDAERRAWADAWIAMARAKGYRVHVTFNYSARTPLKNPSVAQYTSATKAFVARHKVNVESWGVFNEVNRGTVAGRFTTPGPKLAAQLFTAFRTKVCVGCKTVGIDLLDGQSIAPTLRYLTTFNQSLKVQPKIWGLHNYSDTNRASMTRTAALLKAVKGEVWVTETGGLYSFGQGFLPNAKRQSAAVRQVFTIAAKYPRLTRVYFYNFYGPGEDRPEDIFDAGLISGENKVRPAYNTLKAKLG